MLNKNKAMIGHRTFRQYMQTYNRTGQINNSHSV